MSILSRLWKGVRGTVAPLIGSLVGGPIGGIIGGALGGTVSQVPAAPVPPQVPMMPGVGRQAPSYGGYRPSLISGASNAMSLLPLSGATVGRAAGVAVGMGIRGARTIAASAMTYCRRHPQWCSTIGGIAAVEALVGEGKLPTIKRRRRKGISAGDLAKFRRVASTLHKWAPMVTGRKPRRC